MYYSIYDEKFDKIRNYNHDALHVLKENKKQYHKEIKEHLNQIVNRDQEIMRIIPKDLCGEHIQKRFLQIKRNQVTRRLKSLIQEKTLHDWQLPKLKNDVEKYR